MPIGVYTRTAAHGEAIVRGKREAEAARQTAANGSEELTARCRAAIDLADFASEQISEAVKSDDFALARAWIDLSELVCNSE